MKEAARPALMEHIFEISYDWREFVLHRVWWRSTQWSLYNSQESAQSQQLETWSGCRFLGKIFQSTRSRIAILADEITCNNRTQSCAGRLHLHRNLWKRRESTLFERLSTPRPAPKVTLKSNWQSQQQQQQQPLSGDVPSSSGKSVAVETGKRDVRGNATEDLGLSNSRKQVRHSVSLVDKKATIRNRSSSGRSQDAILQDEEQMKEINRKLEKLRIGSCTKSIRDDLKKKGDMIFSEESSRATYEVGNLELIEQRQTSATIQCLSFLKHIPDGLNMCLCGVWIRPNQDTTDRIRATFAALKTPYYRTAITLSRGKKHGHNQWQIDHGEAVDAKKGARRRGNHTSILEPSGSTTTIFPSFSGGDRMDWDARKVSRLHLHGWHQAWSVLPTQTSFMRTYSSWEISLPIHKQDHCGNRENFKPSANALVSIQQDQGKGGVPQIPLHLRTREQNTLDPECPTTLWMFEFELEAAFLFIFVLRHGLKAQHGGAHNTRKILNSGESGNQKNGKINSGGTNGQEPSTTGSCSLYQLQGNRLRANIVSIVAEVDLSSQFSVQSCTFISHIAGFSFFVNMISRPWHWRRGSVQITPHRTHASAHFSRAHHTSHISSNAPALAQGIQAILCVFLKSHPIRAPFHFWVFLSSLRSLLSWLRLRRLRQKQTKPVRDSALLLQHFDVFFCEKLPKTRNWLHEDGRVGRRKESEAVPHLQTQFPLSSRAPNPASTL